MDESRNDAKQGNARPPQGSGLPLHDGLALRRPAILDANPCGSPPLHSVSSRNQRLRYDTAFSSRPRAIYGHGGTPVRGNDRANCPPAPRVRDFAAHHDLRAAASPQGTSRRLAPNSGSSGVRYSLAYTARGDRDLLRIAISRDRARELTCHFCLTICDTIRLRL